MGRAARNAIVALAVGLAALSFAPLGAQAQHHGTSGIFHADIHGTFPFWWPSFGPGFRLDITFLPDGAVPHVDDTMAISFGGDLLYFWDRNYYEGWAFLPTVNWQWNFYFNEHWSAFGEAGIAFLFGPNDAWKNHYYGAYVAPSIYIGGRYHFTPDIALILRIGFPVGAEFGITF